MRIITLAVLLTISQASPPVPRQTPDNSTQTGSAVQQQTESKNDESPPSPPTPKQTARATDKQSAGHNDATERKGQHDTQYPVVVRELPSVTVTTPKRDLADWGTWAFNLLLVVVGTLQAILLCWTFRLIKHQAREATRQRVWMGRQWGQMKSAGEQTDKLITQATEQAAKTGIAADAAQKSANAIMDIERARIVIEKIELTVTNPGGGPDHPRFVSFFCAGRNFGGSPAVITHIDSILDFCEKRDASDSPLTEKPYQSTSPPYNARIVPPRRPFYFTCDHTSVLDENQRKAIFDGPPWQFMFAHGIVRYKDAFGREWYTRFNYRYDVTYFSPQHQAGFYFSVGPPGFNAWT